MTMNSLNIRPFLVGILALVLNTSFSQESSGFDFSDDLLKHHYLCRSANDSFPEFSDSLLARITRGHQIQDHFQRIYSDRGNFNEHVGNPGKAFDEFNKMYDLAIFYKDTVCFGVANGSIAWLNSKYGRDELAIKRFKVNLTLWKSIGDFDHAAAACQNIQTCLINLENYGEALEYSKEGYNYCLLIQDTTRIMEATYWLAKSYADVIINKVSTDSSLIDSALYLNDISMEYHQRYNHRYLLSRNFLLEGEIKLMKGEYPLALKFCSDAIKSTVNNTSNADLIVTSCDCIAQAYAGMGKFNEALVWKEKFRFMSDSLSNLGRAVELEQKELTENLEQQKLETQLLADMEREKKEAELAGDLKSRRIYIVVGIAMFSIFIGIFFWIRKNARKKEFVNQQIGHFNREITDSINYARRIQTAILPSEANIRRHFEHHFIYYQPKDIVAGDFYWFEDAGDHLHFAAADCTGHGVPGAMVSVVCHNALNRAVREFRLDDPGAILDRTKELVIEAFQNKGFNDKTIRDGMDISLCTFGAGAVKNGIKEIELRFAGAHNPVWILRKDAAEMEIIKGTRQPIGQTYTTVPFESHTVTIYSGDQVYFFTDGFADQFGGPEGKKFRYKTLRTLLVENSRMSMHDQRKALEIALGKWMSDIEQIDDVCVIGVRI